MRFVFVGFAAIIVTLCLSSNVWRGVKHLSVSFMTFVQSPSGSNYVHSYFWVNFVFYCVQGDRKSIFLCCVYRRMARVARALSLRESAIEILSIFAFQKQMHRVL